MASNDSFCKTMFKNFPSLQILSRVRLLNDSRNGSEYIFSLNVFILKSETYILIQKQNRTSGGPSAPTDPAVAGGKGGGRRPSVGTEGALKGVLRGRKREYM